METAAAAEIGNAAAEVELRENEMFVVKSAWKRKWEEDVIHDVERKADSAASL